MRARGSQACYLCVGAFNQTRGSTHTQQQLLARKRGPNRPLPSLQKQLSTISATPLPNAHYMPEYILTEWPYK